MAWLTWLAGAGVCLGGWGAGNWPSYEHPRNASAQMEEVYEATIERCVVVEASEPDEPAWFRSNRGNLIVKKGEVKALVTSFVDKSQSVGGSFVTWLNANDPADIPLWTVTAVLEHCKLPTNYFEYTPWRALSGLGWDTTDATVGHPHGGTNSDTEAGGGTFPTGRGRWYTTDYGVQGLKEVLNELVWIREEPYLADDGTQWLGYGDDYHVWYNFVEAWTNATNAADLAWAPGLLWDIVQGSVGWRGYEGGSYWTMYAREWYGFEVVISCPTQYARSSDFYVKTDIIDPRIGAVGYTNLVYTNWGLNVVSGEYALVYTTDESKDEPLGTWEQETNRPPVWCGAPYFYDESTSNWLHGSSSLGWEEVGEKRGCVKYDGVLGFEYK